MQGIIETFLLAMTPIGELRLAIPVGLTVYNLHWFWVYVFAVLGNLVPTLLILLLLKPIKKTLGEQFAFFHKIFAWWSKKTRKATKMYIQQYGAVGLFLFVAVPFPITGAWTGSLAASLFDIPFKKAFPAIFLGVLSAGYVVMMATFAGVSIAKTYGFASLVLAGMLAVFFTILKIVRKFKRN